ncbi:hypothetical protein TeGR_g3376 [Tetraparma gracilis]|jgi:large subunit ribosomal protein L23Ae|uniref:Uncharacterized protein n=1 Tax=Tetraparma gracilis TaxID=2962635 RepID=A0ABQ6M634_9STRA|nr:hypothetical protein TeGR_g3376 [Tetraparma gracilis]
MPASKAKAVANKVAGKKVTTKKGAVIRTKTHFYRGKTQTIARKGKYATSISSKMSSPHSIIKSPLTTESAMKKIEDNNTLVFLVAVTANKRQIKAAVRKLYDIEVKSVNTLIRSSDGQKKAYVRLTADFDALDVANRVGVI